jgi:hypothetical protein
MKRVALLFLLAGFFIPLASAQDHFQAGIYADYLHFSQTSSNLAGLGARVGFKAFPHVILEGEMSYDFAQAFTEGFADTTSGSLSFQQTNMRVLHGLFGPKVEGGHGRLRPFVTVKGGFTNFRLDARPPSLDTLVSSVENLRANNVSGVLYPGAGVEGHLGPVGLRLDVGDEIYFNGGTRHNFRLAFGPFLRF